MLLFILSIAPGIAIAWYIYNKDNYDKEPKKHLIISFLLGMASTIPAIILQLLSKKNWGEPAAQSSIQFYAFFAFVIVALSEELSKFMMVRWYAYPKPTFDEPIDGIVYSVMVSMGFATLENIGYVQQNGLSTALLRMFLSVPAHGAFGVIMGYYLGLAKFSNGSKVGLLLKGLLIAVFFHGIFDFFLFLQESKKVTGYISEGLLVLGAVLSYLIAIRFSIRSIRLHRELSRLNFNQKNTDIV
jgi:protease PrsW